MSIPDPPSPFGSPSHFGPPPFGGPGARPPRPTTVTAAAGLMFLQALLSVLGIAMAYANRGILEDVARHSPDASKSPIKPEVIAHFSLIFGSFCGGLLAILFLVLGALILRGNNVARIVTWVVAGLFLLCSGLSGLVNAFGPDHGEPGWYKTYSAVSAVAEMAIFVAVIALLAVRQSHEFFGRPPQSVQQY
jgi:hypothetical protein